jgi:hypothetical protein
MVQRFVDLLFGCSHQRTTFPLTLNRANGPYVTCLDCGKEFAYDWKEMRRMPKEAFVSRQSRSESLAQRTGKA